MPRSTNRTKWPVSGGALAFQPGWFPGHATALIYVNLGFGEIPENMSHPVVSPFQITGPTNNPYPGTVCLPQVPLPANISVSPGDYATIQVVETAKHGAALYNVCYHYNATASVDRYSNMFLVRRHRVRRRWRRVGRDCYSRQLLQFIRHIVPVHVHHKCDWLWRCYAAPAQTVCCGALPPLAGGCTRPVHVEIHGFLFAFVRCSRLSFAPYPWFL